MKFKYLALACVFIANYECQGMDGLDLPELFPESIDNYAVKTFEFPSKSSVLKLQDDEETEEAINNSFYNSVVPLNQCSSQELMKILQYSETFGQQAIQQCREQLQERQTNAHATKHSAIIYTCLRCFKSDLSNFQQAAGHLRCYHGISRKEFLENKSKYVESKKVFIG